MKKYLNGEDVKKCRTKIRHFLEFILNLFRWFTMHKPN